MAPKQSSSSRDLRHRVLTCVNRLSDKDTHRQAVVELESIIPTLSSDTFSLFINSVSSASTSADRAAVRSVSLRLLASLSSSHGRFLSPHLPKLVAAVVRRLRDHDSAVRVAAASAVAAFSGNVTNSPFSAIFRPFSDALATEQDVGAQAAAAMCLAAAIEASPAPEVGMIVKMLPKWMKLLKCESFKAKAAVLGLMRSAIRVCEVGNCNLLRDLVTCMAELLKSEDWASRKAAAEALKEAALVERDSLSEVKVECLKTFQSRRFDKVKAVREAMSQMVEAWKEIPDVFDDGSPPPHSQASSKDNENGGGCYPRRSKLSRAVDSSTPQTGGKTASKRRLSLPDSALKTTAGNRGAQVKDKRSSPLKFRNLEFKKPSCGDVEAIDLHSSSVTRGYERNPAENDKDALQRDHVVIGPSKPEAKRSLFNKNHMSRVAPYSKDGSEDAVIGSNDASADICRHHKDCEDLSLIRKQLVQIENQQSNLMDLLQKFIGSSQDGMRALETRVSGLEMVLDDISYDMAVSTARMSNVEHTRTSCWSLPGSGFLSSKFWRRPADHTQSPASASAMHNIACKSPAGNAFKFGNRRARLQGGTGGVIVNPLAQIRGDSRAIAQASSSRVLKNVPNVA